MPALRAVTAALPRDFPAAVFVVMHIPPHSPSELPEILAREGPLPAGAAEDEQAIEPGRVYVAPPDHHLLLEPGRTLVKRGPKENRSRPSVDALFRSAAYSYRARVIGVVLSGALDDGTSGLWSVKRLGGRTIVQEPSDAGVPDMPNSAIEHVEVDHVAAAAEIGPLLAELAGKPAARAPDVAARDVERLKLEIEIATQDDAFERGVMNWGELTPFTCPECHGILVQLNEDTISRFRCHTGHAFSISALLAGVDESVESLFWQAMRGLEENTMLLRHMAEHFAEAGEKEVAELFFDKAHEKGKLARAIHDSLPRHEQVSGELRREAESGKRR